MLYYQTIQDYYDLIGDWQDPNPEPIIHEHDGFLVVRDDLFDYGSKARFADFLVKTSSCKEMVYGGSPPQGWAPISLAYLCKKYDKKAIFYVAARAEANFTDQQKKAIDLGGEFRMVPMGFMKNCIAAAKRYVHQDTTNRFFVPIGVDHETVIACASRVMENLKVKHNLNPKRIFSVAGTGTLSRALQMAFPESEVHAVQTGHKLKPHEKGRAIVHESQLAFNQCVKKQDIPPYNSVSNYDAKAWKYAKQYGEPGDLIWNVAGNL